MCVCCESRITAKAEAEAQAVGEAIDDADTEAEAAAGLGGNSYKYEIPKMAAKLGRTRRGMRLQA